jgi:hypothetical protein
MQAIPPAEAVVAGAVALPLAAQRALAVRHPHRAVSRKPRYVNGPVLRVMRSGTGDVYRARSGPPTTLRIAEAVVVRATSSEAG